MKSVIIALLTAMASVSHAAEPQVITLLHTNDLHGHIRGWTGWEGELAGKTIGGFDRIASVVEQVRAETPNVILLDAGDALGDTMIAHLTEGRAILSLMNAVGYDAMTLGNHEPDFTTDKLRKWIADAKFPVLAANVVEKQSGDLFTKPYTILEVAGWKIGVLGLAYPNTSLTTAAKNVDDVSFEPPAAAARRWIPELHKEGAQLIIALTHLGLGADKKLAEAVPEISVIVGGHSHNRMDQPIKVGDTLIVQAGAHGSDVGRLDLTLENGRIVSHKRKLITLDHEKIPADPDTAELVASLEKPFRSRLDEIVGEAADFIPRAQTLAGQDPRKRDAMSPADELFGDILREVTESDIALLPGVGYGVALPRGPITAEALRNLMPHESKVVTLTLTGAQVREILQQAVENTFTDDPAKKVGGMIQPSGLTFDYDREAPEGEKITAVQVGGEPLADEREYRVVTNSMLAGGGHRYRTFLAGRQVTEHDSQFETIKAAIQKRGRLDPPKP